MVTTMKLVMVGGHARNVGKTSVVAGIIRGLREFNWTAAKITQFGHGVCSVNGEACGCAVSEHQFSITEERRPDNREGGGEHARANKENQEANHAEKRPNVLAMSCKARLVDSALSYQPGRALAAPWRG